MGVLAIGVSHAGGWYRVEVRPAPIALNRRMTRGAELMANAELGAAKAAKDDEFYTQWADIEPELGHRSAILASVGAVTCGDAVAWCFV